jgi:hypothetical protein
MDGAHGPDEVEPIRESVVRRRRRWSDREKVQIVREVQCSGAILQEVAQSRLIDDRGFDARAPTAVLGGAKNAADPVRSLPAVESAAS